jgi:hypothetical protein
MKPDATMVAEGFMRPYILMLWGAFAFACMGAFTHAAKDYCDWQVIAFARSGVALLIAGFWRFATSRHWSFCGRGPSGFAVSRAA